MFKLSNRHLVYACIIVGLSGTALLHCSGLDVLDNPTALDASTNRNFAPIQSPAPVRMTQAPQPQCPAQSLPWEVRFSPSGGSTQHLVAALNQAQESVYVQAYSFTSAAIANALVEAKKRGVDVQILLDRSDQTGRGSMLKSFVDNKMNVLIDSKHAIAHNKIMIIDHKIVFTGSFNFTQAAEKSNAENSLELFDPKMAQVYLDNWNVHKTHSVAPAQ